MSADSDEKHTRWTAANKKLQINLHKGGGKYSNTSTRVSGLLLNIANNNGHQVLENLHYKQQTDH